MGKSAKMTLMQKKAMENIASGKYNTFKDAMIDAGYSEGTAIHPGAKLVDSKAVSTIFQQETQNVSSRLNEILEKALQNCADAIGKGDKTAIDAWKSEFSAKFLKLFERQTKQLIEKKEQDESMINHEELEENIVWYLRQCDSDQRKRIFNRAEKN